MKSTFGRLIHTTPFPNILIDEVMPCLKDTAWRVLCVIVRQTLGWHDDVSGLRKERDWLTRSQLKMRTGRNSEAIALAIDTLVRNGYIAAQNSEGMQLTTPQDRRNNHGRIYYCLSNYWRNQIGLSEYRKSEQLPWIAGAVFHERGRKTQHIAGRNPNTAKETHTKEIQADNCADTIISEEVLSFIEVFQMKAQEYGIKKSEITLSPDTHDRLVSWLQRTANEKQMLTLQQYFCSDWLSIVQQRYSLHAFANICNILRID